MTAFYAINLVGAAANMIHPLSSEKEIEFYLKESGSLFAITLDQFYHKFEAVRQNVTLDNIILASIRTPCPSPSRSAICSPRAASRPKFPRMRRCCAGMNSCAGAAATIGHTRRRNEAEDVAVILYSGGTTGVTKGIQLTNLNFNALGAQVLATNPMFRPGDKMLAVMPMFHGFGLGISIHTMLSKPAAVFWCPGSPQTATPSCC